MLEQENRIKIAINSGIGFGFKLNVQQLMKITELLNEGEEVEITTFQQIYIEIDEDKKELVIQELEKVGLSCYPVGGFVKSLRTCNFCKGELEEGMPVAKELNRRIAGREVPFTLKPAYTGCPVGCGEPLVNDIGVMKIKEQYNLYIGGKSKGNDAQVGSLIKEGLEPEELYQVVDRIIDIYAQNGKKRENLAKFINRFGLEQMIDLIF